MDQLQAEEEARAALLGLLHLRGICCSDNDLWVKLVNARGGHRVYVVIGLNGTEAVLSGLARTVAGRRKTSVGVDGVFVLRPNDLRRLITQTGNDIVDTVTTACERARRMMDDGSPPHEVLTCLVTAAEIVSAPRAVASILVLDEDGLLRNGASPNLPRDYLNAIDRLKPDPNVGTCAAAAATGSVVLTPSFLADDKWAELRHLPVALGFVGAWSMPIKSSSDGRVLGTFGTYYRDVREPTAREMDAIRMLARTASQVLDGAGAK